MEISKICEKIKERRKILDMTQKDLADAMHVSNQLISKWETGESVPSLEYIGQLSEALQMSAQELMGITPEKSSAPVESEQPAANEVKTKPPKFKAFWKKYKKPLIISIACAAASLLIVMFALLSVFVFVPDGNKENYFEEIDQGIDRYLELGYFNIRHSTEKDGDEDKYPRILQGYYDENGDVAYYNSVTKETVKNKKILKDGVRFEYEQPETSNTVPDLLKEQLKTWGEESADFDIEKYVGYIRKDGGVYYMEFDEEYFFEDMPASQRKNIELTEKIKGKAETWNGITKYISVSVKFKNTVTGEKFSVDSKIEFLQEKPRIEIEGDFLKVEGKGAVGREQFWSALGAVSLKESLSEGAESFLQSDVLRFENGYVFRFDGNAVTVYDPVTLHLQDVWIASNKVECATVYNGRIWYVEKSGSSRTLYRYNLGGNAAVLVLNLPNSSVGAFNGRYLYYYVDDGESGGSVFDLKTQRLSDVDELIRYVDKSGNVYCYTAEDQALFIYGKSGTLKGTEIVKEENGCVYTRDASAPTVLYRYRDGVLQKTVRLPSQTFQFAGDYCWEKNGDCIYDTDGNVVKRFSDISLKADNYRGYDTISSANVFEVNEEFTFVSFNRSSYFCVYRTGEWDSPIAYTKDYKNIEYYITSPAVRFYRNEDSIYLIMYNDTSKLILEYCAIQL